MPMVGTVPQFEKFTNFEEWTEVLEAWFESNGIEDNGKKRSVFLTSIGSKAYHTLRALVQPAKPSDKTYAECVKALKTHFLPKPTEIVQRYRFYSCSQQPGESLAQFVAKLWQLSEGCNFRELDNMLRDRLVVGVKDASIQKKLLSETALTFAKAFSMATAMEMAQKDVESIKQIGTPSTVAENTVHKVGYRKPQSKQPENQQSRASAAASSKTSDKKCWRCGGKHSPRDCPFISEKCYKCQKKGHTKSQCEAVKAYQQTQAQRSGKAHHLDEKEESEPEEEVNHFEGLNHFEGSQSINHITDKPYYALLQVENKDLHFEVDSGSPWSMMSRDTFRQIGDTDSLSKSPVNLRTYTGSMVPILGKAKVRVRYKNLTKQLPLLVVKEGVTLMGRDWMRELGIKLNLRSEVTSEPATVQIHSTQTAPSSCQSQPEAIVAKHKGVFDTSQPGKLKGFQAKVHAAKEEPLFYKAAPVTYASRHKIEAELEALQEKGIIEPVAFSDYACPIVTIDKPNGKIRLCGNYKLTANKVLRCEQYPIPTLEDLVQDLQGGQHFSKLDLSHAYHQIELEENARKYTTINTHRGLFQYTRLPFGIASAPAIFQRTLESLLANIPMCRPYLDDIIISGRNTQEHLENLSKVFQRLEESGLKLQKSKCELFRESVVYLGHTLDSQGLRPLPQKIREIQEAPRPQNQTELQAYLGLLGYYRKFVPKLADEIVPLTQLLQKEYSSGQKKAKNRGKFKSTNPGAKDSKFVWGPAQERAFARSKELLQSNSLLVHFDPCKPILLQTDASPYGLGAVISHKMDDGSERPIAFASRKLSTTEQKYAQFEKEGLSIVFGLKKFHKFLHGRHFTIVTDHKPLVSLFGSQKPANAMASARVTRWHMILSAYDFEIEHKAGSNHSNADALSRLPLDDEEKVDWLFDMLLPTPDGEQVNLLNDVDQRPIEATEIKASTKKDPILARVREYILGGWPDKRNLGEEYAPFSQKRQELSVEDDIVLWGHRVVIPKDSALQSILLEELHATHPGIVKMKALARSFFWWPAIDRDLEQKCRECEICQEHQKQPQLTPIHPWEFPENPWTRLHIDYASMSNQDVLIVVDAHSKWIEAVRVQNATAAATITAMRRMFATHGIPETIVSDNGTQFVSEEFTQFLTSNNIEHVQTAPKHPASNGLAERAVQTIKNGVKKITEGSLELKLQKVLMRYRITPQATTGKCPSELLYRRRIRSRLDQVRPNIARKVKIQQSGMTDRKNTRAKSRNFYVQDPVLAKNFAPGPTWLKGVVTEILNPAMCEVDLEDGRKIRRHNDQLRLRTIAASDLDACNDSTNVANREAISAPIPIPQSVCTPTVTIADTATDSASSEQASSKDSVGEVPMQTPDQVESNKQNLTDQGSTRVSTRKKYPSVLLKDYVVYK